MRNIKATFMTGFRILTCVRYVITAMVGLLGVVSCSSGQQAQQYPVATAKDDNVFVFASFRGNGEDGLHLAYSEDGLIWKALNQDISILAPKVGGKLMRDPCIIQGPDGLFHMVWTSSWEEQGIGIAHSKDLIHWSEQRFIPVMQDFATAKNAWAPEISWDPDQQRYIIYWASTLPGTYPQSEAMADKGWDHRIYATTTQDFVTYTPTQLYYQPGFNVIDASIHPTSDGYVMLLKDETRYPAAKNLYVATSNSMSGPWNKAVAPFSPEGIWVEGPTLLKTDDWYYVYYDEYTRHQYGAMRTQDFIHWQNVSDQIQLPSGTRHGTVVAISRVQLKALIDAY